MKFHAELFLGAPRQLGKFHGGLAGAALRQEVHDRAGQLVRSARTGFFRNQSRQTVLLESGLGLIERRPRESGLLRRAADRGLLGLDAPQPLVLDLQEIGWLE